MTTHRLLVTVLALSALACGKLAPATAGLGEACVRNADCATPYVCSDGACTLDQGRACEPSTRRCNGSVVELCATTGAGWQVETTCTTGCAEGQCNPLVCEPGALSCDGAALMRCRADGAGYVWERSCQTDCDPATKACKPPVCDAFEGRCGEGGVREVCDERGLAWVATPCDAEEACSDGRCMPRICEAAQTRCSGDSVETCSGGTAFAFTKFCAYGCGTVDGRADCRQAACAAGQERCSGDALERCTPDLRGFALVQFCPSGCAGTPAKCTPPVCQPLARQCAVDQATGRPVIEQCSADGRGFTALETCPQSCVNGSCVVDDAGCVPGARRCSGQEAQVCLRLTNGATEWRFEERCLGVCQGGACDTGGACGCSGGDSAVACGAASRKPVTVNVLLPADTTVPADGRSTVLVHTDPITNAAGELVPDGTLVTFAHDGTDQLLASGDADALRPGLQRPTIRGRARVVVRAPSAARDVSVTATLGGSCAGSALVKFGPPATGTVKSVYVAEDFSTTRAIDRPSTTAQLDVIDGRLYGAPNFKFGTGADGDYDVAANETRDLATEPIARFHTVVGIGRDNVLVDTLAPGIFRGDEVLLATVSGAAAAAGVYEFKTVAAVEASRIVFTEPVRRTYGATTNDSLTGQRVVIQRVPQFRNVTVGSGATLTSTSIANGGTGMVAFRATGTVRVLGSVNLNERGLPAGTAPTALSTPSLDRFLVGGGATRAGGGALFISAKTITVKAEGSTVPAGILTTSSPGGYGGSIWLQSGSLVIATGRLNASGTADTSTQRGQIRLDYGSIDVAQATGAGLYVGLNGAYVATSVVVHQETSASILAGLRVVGAIGGSGGVVVRDTPSDIAGLRVFVLADGGSTNWMQATNGAAAFSPQGRSFKWKLELATLSDLPLELFGIAFRIDAQ